MLSREQMISDFRAILDDVGQLITINDTELLAIVKDGGTEMLSDGDERQGLGGSVSIMELRFIADDWPHLPKIGSDLTINGEAWTVNNRWKLCLGTTLKLQLFQEVF